MGVLGSYLFCFAGPLTFKAGPRSFGSGLGSAYT